MINFTVEEQILFTKLKMLRKAMDVSMQSVGKKVGWTRQTIDNIESGACITRTNIILYEIAVKACARNFIADIDSSDIRRSWALDLIEQIGADGVTFIPKY